MSESEGRGAAPPRTPLADWLAQMRTIGWAAIEAGFLLVAVCVLLNIILGDGNGFVTAVANNATGFLQRLPPGVVLGMALIAAGYGIVRGRLVR